MSPQLPSRDATATARRLTEPQFRFVQSLIRERDVYAKMPEGQDREEWRRSLEDQAGRLTIPEASEWIERLKALPRVETSRGVPVEWPDVPAGRYAIERPDGAMLGFYKVDRPTEGRWDGFTFLSAQASDEWHSVREPSTKRDILERIAADPVAAGRRYGIEIGECYKCGRTLTDETSRRLGIGPVCRGEE